MEHHEACSQAIVSLAWKIGEWVNESRLQPWFGEVFKRDPTKAEAEEAAWDALESLTQQQD